MLVLAAARVCVIELHGWFHAAAAAGDMPLENRHSTVVWVRE